MARREVVVIGGSAGALEALQAIVRGLPADLPAAVCVALHTAPDSPGALPGILRRTSPLPVNEARPDEPLQTGRVYIARPDHHLVVNRGLLRTTRGPRENGFRPAVDPLFRTAARAYGPQCIGVVLSGALDDGVYGLKLIKKRGGLAVVQDPEEALVSGMPRNAIDHVQVDHVMRAMGIPALLERLVHEEVTMPAADPNGQPRDVAELEYGAAAIERIERPPSPFTCPDCGGVLWDNDEEGLLRFRCHEGHGFTADGLMGEQSDKLEAALWSALRALDECMLLHRRMAERARRHAEDTRQRADVLRQVLFGEEPQPAAT
jgi:two-component system, chemotaxis family, protein-glutamate methylesterase/glutaminase